MTANGSKPITRRFFIGAVLAGGAAASLRPPDALAEPAVHSWRGQALGAHATIRLVGAPETLALQAMAEVEREIARLESIFSLYRPESALMRLNRAGSLEEPPQELLEVLSLAASVHRRTEGLFDPTVQPLFVLLAEHFAGGNRRPPAGAAVETALRKVGFDGVRFDAGSIAFARPGMALTLNGIAQGYITDRVAALLRARGFSNVLADIGEISAIGNGPGGGGWRVGISDGEDGIADTLSLRDRAIATSMARGTTLDAQGRIGHILHPRKGIAPAARARVTVVDASAAVADAYSTAAILMDDRQLAGLRAAGIEVVA